MLMVVMLDAAVNAYAVLMLANDDDDDGNSDVGEEMSR